MRSRLRGTHSLWRFLERDQDDRRLPRAVRALADPSQHETTFVGSGAELLAAAAHAPVFQQGGYGFPNTPTVAPDAGLWSMLAWISRRVAAYSKNGPLEPRPDPDALYPPDVRATVPEPAEQLDAALALQLTRAEKQVLDLLTD